MTQHTPRAIRITRIVLGIAALVIVLAIAYIVWNLRAVQIYNSATATLTSTMQSATQSDADLQKLLASQRQTDTQFDSANEMSALLLPSIRNDVQHNAEVSRVLTERIEQQLKTSTDATNDSTNTNADNNASDGSQSALTEEQRKQIEEMLKNNENQQSTDSTLSQDNTQNNSKQQGSAGTTKPW